MLELPNIKTSEKLNTTFSGIFIKSCFGRKLVILVTTASSQVQSHTLPREKWKYVGLWQYPVDTINMLTLWCGVDPRLSSLLPKSKNDIQWCTGDQWGWHQWHTPTQYHQSELSTLLSLIFYHSE